MTRALATKIRNKKAIIAVVGLGYVGLPLAVSFAKARFKVIGLDNDTDRVTKVNKKRSYISDIPSKELKTLVDKGYLKATLHLKELENVDVVLICVPTPLKSKYTPDISFILKAVQAIRKYLKKGALVVLESTTYPGTTKEIILPELEKGGKKIDRDFYLSFSPERIDPGNKQYHVTQIPKIVGGITKDSGHLTKLLYEKIIKEVHPVSSARAAEMTKLLENSFRIINIGWINEVAMMCHEMGIDVWEVIDAAKTKPFGFMPFYPGLGVGGHCIPDDPLYLYWKARHYGYQSKYIKLSADTNSGMPSYAARRIKKLLADKKKSIRNAKILVVGVTYKKDVRDLRKSPPLKLINSLQSKGAKVDYHDPIISYLDFGKINLKSIKLSKNSVAKFDCVVIATDHTRINYKLILDNARQIFDVRNVYKGREHKKLTRL